jgi:tRNA(fMet)-specific endonuclease VapC
VKYLLDTDHISILQRASGAEFVALSARMAQHPAADFALSLVSFHEQVLGAQALISRARTTADLIRSYAVLQNVLQDFSTAIVLPFDAAAAAVFDGLQQQRVRVGTMDLRIASIALSQGLILLTRNTRDFSRVPGLLTEDWTK